MHWSIIAGIVVAGVLVLNCLVQWICSQIILRIFERTLPLRVEPAEPQADAEIVSFPTTDGLTLRGSLFRRKTEQARGLVIFCPELNGGHFSAMQYCGALPAEGFDVLSFDFRNQGGSEWLPAYQPLHWVTDYEVHDVLAAIEFVRSREDLQKLPIGLMGISRGGGAALSAAALNPDISCIAVEGTFCTAHMLEHYTLQWAGLYVPPWALRFIPKWHLRLTLRLVVWRSGRRRRCRYTSLQRLLPSLSDRSVLMIAGENDSYVPANLAKALFDRIQGESAEFWTVPQARHNLARTVEPEQYDAKLIELFSQLDVAAAAENLRQPSSAADGVPL